MPAFKVALRREGGHPFTVVGPGGAAVGDIDDFPAHLDAPGRSGYTQRSYAPQWRRRSIP